MIEVEGTVTSTAEGLAWISRVGGQMCSQCDVKSGCRAMAITRLFCKREASFRVRDPIGVTVGERVHIGITEVQLLKNALIGYGVPLLLLILGAVLGLYWGQEYLSIMGGVFGLLTAMLWVKGRKMTVESLPVILRKKGGVS